MNATENLPDHTIARQEFQKILDGLKLTFEVSSATGVVSEDGDHVSLSYVAIINGQSFDYSMGIGHIDWTKVDPDKNFYSGPWVGFSEEEKSFIRTYKRKNHCVFKENGKWAAVCAKVANKLKTKPMMVDVLSCVMLDKTALEMTFDDWCSEFGYDVDSRKAEKCYNACCDNARRALKFLSRKDMEALTELANRL
jgi:hypothetical protein